MVRTDLPHGIIDRLQLRYVPVLRFVALQNAVARSDPLHGSGGFQKELLCFEPPSTGIYDDPDCVISLLFFPPDKRMSL